RRGDVRRAEAPLHPCRPVAAATAARAKLVRDPVLALAHCTEINAHGAGRHAVVRPTPGEVGHPRARHHGLGRRAADVDAGATNIFPLDDGRPPPRARQRRAEWSARLPRTDDDGVEALYLRHVVAIPSFVLPP